MVNTFLKILSYLEDTVLKSNARTETKNTLKRLIGFVESGSFTDSAVEKFILANFRCSSVALTEKWNKIHFDKKKSSNTFRSQVSSLNSYLSSLFSMSGSELNDAFVNEDIESFKCIIDIIDAFAVGDFNIATRFPIIVQNYLSSDETDSVYTVEDCEKEIKLLKSLDIKVIDEMMKGVDIDKLTFVLQTIRQPLVVDKYTKIEGKLIKVKTPRINQQKLKFNKEFNLVKAKELRPVDSIEVQEQPVVYDNDKSGVSKKENIPFSLCITKQLSDVLVNGINTYNKFSMETKEALMMKSTDESRKKVEQFLNMYTVDGFVEELRKLNPFDVITILEGYRNDEV